MFTCMLVRKIHGCLRVCTCVVLMVIAYQFKLEQPKSGEEQDAVIVKKILHFIGFISYLYHFPNLNQDILSQQFLLLRSI